MFERYDEPARRCLFFAQYDARARGSLAIETEHLLLGLLRVRDSLVPELLRATKATVSAVRHQIYLRIGMAPGEVITSAEIPFSEDVKQVFEYAAEEASRLLQRHIGTEHLLLGLLRLQRGMAWEVLREKDVSITPVREALVAILSATLPPPSEIHSQSGDLYLMTVLDAPSPGRRVAGDATGSMGFASFSTRADLPQEGRPSSIGPIRMSAATLPQFVLVLEPFLGAPVLVEDSAPLTETFDIELQGEYDTHEALVAALRDQLGLVLTKSP